MRRVVFTVVLLTLAVGSGWLLGQQAPLTPDPLVPPGLMTGPDIGIRVDGKSRDGKIYGTVMVRMPNGEWIDVVLGRPGIVPLDTRR